MEMPNHHPIEAPVPKWDQCHNRFHGGTKVMVYFQNWMVSARTGINITTFLSPVPELGAPFGHSATTGRKLPSARTGRTFSSSSRTGSVPQQGPTYMMMILDDVDAYNWQIMVLICFYFPWKCGSNKWRIL
jgi:hypothetical protein